MYEIGDEVIYQGADKSAYKRRGVVASIEEKDGKPQLTVAFGDGEEFTAPIDDWSRAFTNARACNSTKANVRNALNASAKIVTTGNFGTLKVGDRVDFRKSRYWRGTGVVTKVYGDGIIDVKGDNGEGEMEIHEEDIMNSRVRTTNATVRNALNARTAKNAESATDVAGKAGDAYRSAYNELAGCAAYLERIASIGLPNDLRGNDEKTAAWAKKKAQKVRDIMARLDQGRL